MVIGVPGWHMFRVFLTGSTRSRAIQLERRRHPARATLLLSFTVTLLPDDQHGIWPSPSATNMARATPLLGHEGPFGPLLGMTPYNRRPLRPAGRVDRSTPTALLRSYIWPLHRHPHRRFGIMIVHFWRVRKDGGIFRNQRP